MLKTKDGRLLDILILYWKEIYNTIYAINPELAELMHEHYELLKDLPFFVVNYPYGEQIIHNRKVYFPIVGGGKIWFNDSNLPDILHNHLSYTQGVDNPVGMILNNEAEFYRSFDLRNVSYQLIKAGQIFGFAHIIDAIMKSRTEENKKANVSIWNLDAGAKSTFVLPRISESGSHTHLLKAYGIDVEKPMTYIEQGNVFRVLNASVDKPWIQSVLYFPKQFLDMLKINKQCSDIYQEMANIHRSGYSIWHTTYAKWDSDINYIFQKAKVNALSAYAVNIAKHIYLIVAGGVPGFAPATDENMLPKKLIEDAYTNAEGYGLTDYWPTIMQPKKFDARGQPVYYSLALPTLIDYNPETFKGKTSIDLLCKVMMILSRSQEYILNKFEDRDSVLYETAIKAQFSFYHDDPNPEKYGSIIKSSTLLPKEDPRFYKKGWTFPHLSPFVRGCIKIEPVTVKVR